MQKISILVAAIIAIIIAASFFFLPFVPHLSATKKLEVTVTTNIIADAVRTLAGDTITLNCLMQPGIDPHSYHARLSDMRALLQSDIIIYNGLHLEGKMAHVFEKMQNIKPTYAIGDALSKDRLIASSEFDTMYDPHIWFDVSLWKKVVQFIANTLSEHNPAQSTFYKSRCTAYLAELDELETYIRTQLENIPKEKRYLITTHDAFSYFARAYSINVVGLQGINLDAEPCMHDMRQLVDLICSKKIPTIFCESSLPARSIEAIAHAVAARGYAVSIGEELYSDTLGATGADTYIKAIKHNVDALVTGLNTVYTMT